MLQKIKNYFVNLFQLSRSKKDRGTLIISICIALIFWFLVKLSNEYSSPKDVYINYILPEDKVFQEMPPRIIVAELQGVGWELMREFFTAKDPVITIDLVESSLSYINSNQLRSKVANAIGNNDVDIVKLNFEDINLALEDKVSKTVPVLLQDSITVAPEHYLRDSILISPDSVLLEGPESVVTELEQWETNTLILTNLSSTTERLLALQEPTNLQLVISPRVVEVTVPVEEFTDKSLFVPIIVKNPPADSIKIFPSKIRLDVTVGLSDYNAIEEEDFQVEVDFQDVPLNAKNNTVPIQIAKQPTAARSVQFSPKSVEFFIMEE